MLYKKTYPDLINKITKRKMLLFTDIIHIQMVTVLVQNSMYTASYPCQFGSFILRYD